MWHCISLPDSEKEAVVVVGGVLCVGVVAGLVALVAGGALQLDVVAVSGLVALVVVRLVLLVGMRVTSEVVVVVAMANSVVVVVVAMANSVASEVVAAVAAVLFLPSVGSGNVHRCCGIVCCPHGVVSDVLWSVGEAVRVVEVTAGGRGHVVEVVVDGRDLVVMVDVMVVGRAPVAVAVVLVSFPV